MLMADRKNPKKPLPPSPRKISALRFKLYGKKPHIDPIAITITPPLKVAPLLKAKTARVIPIITASPDASPFIPSKKLKAFVMPIIHINVRKIFMAFPI